MGRVFERFVAMRYLRDRAARAEGRGFVRFVVIVGVGGVTVGVAALLVALSIVHGFSREIKDKIIGFGAHLQIESQTGTPLRDSGEIRAGVANLSGVVEVRPVVEEFVLLRRAADAIEGVVVRGVPVLPEYLQKHMVDGSPDLSSGRAVIIGKGLADNQGIVVGDIVTLYAFPAPGGGVSASRRPHVRQFRVGGMYETSLEDFDDTVIFVGIDTALALFKYSPGDATRLEVLLGDYGRATVLVDEIEALYGFPVMVRTIEEVHGSLFAWVRLQESIIPIVIGFIVIVAIFNIGGIILMIVMEKTRSLGILVAMGANGTSVRRLVLTLAGLIGVAGVTAGEAVAVALSFVQQRFGVIPLPADAYYMKTAPIAVHPLDFLIVAVATLLLCIVFAYIPARVAERTDPIRVIRFE